MGSFHASIQIDASASRVWSLLTDLPAWPIWNTTIDKVEGSIGSGSRITVYAKASPGRAFPLTVSELVPQQRMVWRGGMPLGLFTGTRTYTLSPRSGDKVEFAMTEAFTGWMAPLITRSIPDLQPSFEQFARCLKAAAERA